MEPCSFHFRVDVGGQGQIQLHYTNINTLCNTKLSLFSKYLPRIALATAQTSVKVSLT